jgi:hypothetical protein
MSRFKVADEMDAATETPTAYVKKFMLRLQAMRFK